MTDIETVRAFLTGLFDPRVDPERLRELVHPDARFVERPSRVAPRGNDRDVDAALAGARVGHTIMASQRYDVRDVRQAGDTVVVRAVWEGTTSRDLPGLAAGTTLRAHVASFWQLHDGRIARLESYDCYEAS